MVSINQPRFDDDFRLVTIGSTTSAADLLEAKLPNGKHAWIVIAPEGSILNPRLREIVLSAASKRPDVSLFYGDEVEHAWQPAAAELFLKPDFDMAMMISTDYVGTPIIVNASALRQVGGIADLTNGAAAYSLVLRVLAAGLAIARITEVLVAYRASRPRIAAVDRIKIIERYGRELLPSCGVTQGRTPESLQLERHFDDYPNVTLLIPTRQARIQHENGIFSRNPAIIDCLLSIAEVNYPKDKIAIIVGDDRNDPTAYDRDSWPFELKIINTSRRSGQAFNYAAKMNALWRNAESDQIVFMNDDLVALNNDWLRALLTFSITSDVGGVGARLLYPNRTLQHAGIPGGLFGLCAHAWLGQPADAPTYKDWANVQREWPMVTGAVFATRKSLMEMVSGFDEALSLEYNDVDLCLRLRTMGYRIVYTPSAEFTHYEKSSRGEHLPPGSELALFLQRWAQILRDDPSNHPKLDQNRFDLKPLPDQTTKWWRD